MPAYLPDIDAALALVVSRLRGVDVEAAVSTGDVNVPGAWVNFVGFGSSVLDGQTPVLVEVAVLVGALDLANVYAALTDLASEVIEELGHPDGPIRKQTIVLGNDPVGLPALVLPYLVEV